MSASLAVGATMPVLAMTAVNGPSALAAASDIDRAAAALGDRLDDGVG
jgi:hypothetical protein